MSDFFKNWNKNEDYFNALGVLASLSGLFSDNSVPYLDYRLAENVFCEFFKAENEARACTAYDAKIDALGIGIKTFILKNGQSTEKVAEFNKLKSELDALRGIDLARKLGEYRNVRITTADNLYGTDNRLYHIVGRCEGALSVFNTNYDFIDIDNIKITKSESNHFNFNDGKNEYFFNRSKSVLIKRFIVPKYDVVKVPVEILSNPLAILLQLFNSRKNNVSPIFPQLAKTNRCNKSDYVILPLYSTRGKSRNVPQKSGLNQWNAGGRKRHPNEVYIPIPIKIHQNYPEFFPSRNEHFTLKLPDGTSLSAKVCQENGKALMSTHNADLGEWILRKVLRKKEGELVTIDDLDRFGIDSVCITKTNTVDDEGKQIFKIDFITFEYESYSEFLGEE